MMSSTSGTPSTSKAMLVGGWILTVLPCLLLFMSGTMKIMGPPEVIDGFKKLGYPETIAPTLGVVELVSTVLYLIPQTSVLGAILLTGYLGGATATHVRVSEPFYGPIVIGMILWLGLFLRDSRIRSLIPFKTR